MSGLRVNTTNEYWHEGSYYTTAPYPTGQTAFVSPGAYEDFSGDDEHDQELEDDEAESGNEVDSRKMKRFRYDRESLEHAAELRPHHYHRLNHHQTRFLMSEFARQAHPDAAHRARLAQEIPGLSPRQVQVWFQNRRAKLKRLPSGDRERMMSSRALPENFDTTQTLHSPLGSGPGSAPLVMSPVYPMDSQTSSSPTHPTHGADVSGYGLYGTVRHPTSQPLYAPIVGCSSGHIESALPRYSGYDPQYPPTSPDHPQGPSGQAQLEEKAYGSWALAESRKSKSHAVAGEASSQHTYSRPLGIPQQPNDANYRGGIPTSVPYTSSSMQYETLR
ncbi:MAG: hypothetical protein M1825_002121 [Sarcosagium campestre]|nr:MAG: hypothetical protein M1825_002121 [Sarcosagium campestre]